MSAVVSVVIPAHQAGRFVGEAIDSVLADERAGIEIVVVDDGSTDDTAAAATRPGVTVISTPNAGPSAARNAGVAAATGTFLAFLDADDRWAAGRLAAQLEIFERAPETDVVLGLAEAFADGDVAPGRFPRTTNGTFGGHLGTALIRAEAFAAVGPFDESLRLGEDLDWLLRASDAGIRSATLEQVVLRYRVHEGNLSGDAAGNRAAALGRLRASAARKRAARTVGAVIPARDAASFLGEALERLLGQTQPPGDVVVVDDGSTDATADVARSFGAPVRVVSQAPAGSGAARNRGAELVRGGWIAFFDADDLLVPGGLAALVAAVAARPEAEIAFGSARRFSEVVDGEPVPLGPVQPNPLTGAMLVRREAFERIGPFSTALLLDGLDWLLRARELGVVDVTIPDQIIWRRVHDANATRQSRHELHLYARALKASLDRRRAT